MAESLVHAEIEELLKWERSLAVATWEKKPGPVERYRRERNAARKRLDDAIAKARR